MSVALGFSSKFRRSKKCMRGVLFVECGWRELATRLTNEALFVKLKSFQLKKNRKLGAY
jgi:hypothetical protein